MYEKQMELFEDGGNVDKVSGNNIPLGSTAKEVRDDQPAMLSEGEMVVPADVVRYFGVEYFMNLRDQAKIGYKKMEAMGQFGTEEGQTLPDDTIFNAGGPPFTIEDIEVIEDYEEGETEEDEEEDNSEKKTIKAANGALVDVSTASNLLPLLVSTAGTLNTVFGGFGSSSGSSTTDTTDSEQDLVSTGSRVAFPASSAKDMMGVETFNYLSSFMPANTINSSTTTERSAVTNYIANLFKNIPATAATATDTTGGDGTTGGVTVDTGGDTSSGVATSQNTPGTGSVAELMSSPTYENIAGLKSFASLADTYAGRAMLSGMGFLTSAALNMGQYAPVVGTVQGLAGMMERGLLGTSTIAEGFQSLKSIPMEQANAANRAAISYENSFKDLDKEQRDMVQVIAALDSFNSMQGVNVMDDPNYSVSIDKDGNIHASHIGQFAANFTYSPHFGWQHTITPTDVKTIDKNSLKSIEDILDQAKKDAALAADPKGSLRSEAEQIALGKGLTGPETDLSISGVPTINNALSYTPEDLPDVIDTSTTTETPAAPPAAAAIADAMDSSFGTDDTEDDDGFGMGSVAESESDASVSGGTSTGTGTGTGTGTASEVGTDEAESTGDPGGDGGDGGGGGGGGGGKIVCTMMNHIYGFNLKQNALWLRYAKVKQLDPAYQIGYHKIFTPLVRKMPTNKTIAFALSWLAKQRTNSIKKELKGAKITLYKSIVRPTLGTVCFITGKLVQKGILKPAKLETLQFNEKP